MKGVPVFLAYVTTLLMTVHGTAARSTYKTKSEDHYNKIENDISNDAPILPIEGGYKEPEDVLGELSYDDLQKFYGAGSIYGADSSYDAAPYYYYAYNPTVVYDLKSPFYTGSDNDFKTYSTQYTPDTDSDENDGTPDETTIYPSGVTIDNNPAYTEEEVYVSTEEPAPAHDEEEMIEEGQIDGEAEGEEIIDAPYWVNRDSNPSAGGYFNNYMMGIPAQLQTFSMFNPQYYQSGYAEYERLAAENERIREELEKQSLDANTLGNPVNSPRGGRVKRGFSRVLHLRDKKEAYVNAKKDKADCRGNRTPNSGNGGTAGDVGNGIAQAAGTAQNAAGEVAGAAGDAVNTAAEAAENLRLRNGRATNNRRNTNNRNSNNNNRRGRQGQ